LAFHFEVLNIILQFQLNQSRCSLYYSYCGRKSIADGQTDGQTGPKHIYVPPAHWAEA